MLKMHQRYGPIVRVAPDQLSYTSSAAIKTIYGAHTLAKDGFVEMDKDRNDYHKSGNGLWPILGAPTAVHRRYRKQFTHAFSDAGIRAMQPRIQAFVGMLIQGLKEVAEKDEYTDILSWYNWTTFDVIGDLAFGASFGCLENKAKHPWIQAIEVHFKSSAVISACKRYGLQFLVPVLMPKKLKAMRASNLRHNERQIEERIKLGTGRGDFWDNVIEKSDFEKGIGMSKPEMVANASVIVLAGSETTATLLAGTTYLLLKHPEIYKKLNEEVRTAFKSEDEINFMSVGRLEYMLAVLDEAMRVYTPVPNMGNRVVPACGATIEGKWVPGGVCISIHPHIRRAITDQYPCRHLSSVASGLPTTTSPTSTDPKTSSLSAGSLNRPQSSLMTIVLHGRHLPSDPGTVLGAL
jgi:averantin hydroxylase